MISMIFLSDSKFQSKKEVGLKQYQSFLEKGFWVDPNPSRVKVFSFVKRTVQVFYCGLYINTAHFYVVM